MTTGSAFWRFARLKGDEGVCNSGAEFEGEKKAAASLRFSDETWLACVRKV